jgi:hypothetical protein
MAAVLWARTITNSIPRTTFDYYTENRWDILLSDGTAPSVLGFTLPYANLGKVDSWGWEVSMKWDDVIGNNFRYFADDLTRACKTTSHERVYPVDKELLEQVF